MAAINPMKSLAASAVVLLLLSWMPGCDRGGGNVRYGSTSYNATDVLVTEPPRWLWQKGGDEDWGRVYPLYILLCLRLGYESAGDGEGRFELNNE